MSTLITVEENLDVIGLRQHQTVWLKATVIPDGLWPKRPRQTSVSFLPDIQFKSVFCEIPF